MAKKKPARASYKGGRKRTASRRDFVQAEMLTSLEVEEGHSVTFMEFESGILAVREGGHALRNSPRLAGPAIQNLGLSGIFRLAAPVGKKMPVELREAQRRSKEQSKKLTKNISDVVREENLLRKKLPSDSSIEDIIPPIIDRGSSQDRCGRPVNVPSDNQACVDDGNWHSWFCDEIWFRDRFCRSGGLDLFCCANVEATVSRRGADILFQTTGMNASFDADAYFWGYRRIGSTWRQAWGEYVRQRSFRTWTFLAEGNRILGEFWAGIIGLRPGEPRVHFSRWSI